ncbi:MAG: hypothetical protein Q9157_002554 [Trypethelium eluteriae]
MEYEPSLIMWISRENYKKSIRKLPLGLFFQHESVLKQACTQIHTEIDREDWKGIEYDNQAEDTRRIKVQVPFSKTLRQNAGMFKRVENELRETKEKLDKTTEKLDETMQKVTRMEENEVESNQHLRWYLQLGLDNLAIKFAKVVKKKASRKRYSDLSEKEETDDGNHSTIDLVRQVQPIAAKPRRLVELDIEGIEEGHAEVLKDLSEVSSRHESHSTSIV